MAVIYRPRHRPQTAQAAPGDPYRMYGCGAYSTAIALDRATLGGCDVSGKAVRARTNEPVPDHNSPGLNLEQLQDAAASFGVALAIDTLHTWASVMARLRLGRGVVLNGDHDVLVAAGEGCGSDFLGLHSIYVNNVSSDGRLLVYNPLCDAYHYLPAALVRHYAEKFPNGVHFMYTRVTPNVNPKDQVN